MTRAERIEQRLNEYYAAESALLSAQEYTLHDGRKLRRADLSEIRAEIRNLERDLVRAKAGGGMMAKQVYTYGA